MGISDDIKKRGAEAEDNREKIEDIKEEVAEEPPEEKSLEPKSKPDEDEVAINYERERVHRSLASHDPFYNLEEENQKNHQVKELEKEFFQPHKKSKKTTPYPKEKKSNCFSWFLGFLILLLVVILVLQNFSEIKAYLHLERYFGSVEENNSAKNNTANLESESNNSLNTLSNSTSNTASTNTTTTATDWSKYQISVLNGNSIKGSASSVANELTAAGFTVKQVANAKKFGYATSIIYYKSGNKSLAEAIKAALPNRTCELTESNTIVGTYDAMVVVGVK